MQMKKCNPLYIRLESMYREFEPIYINNWKLYIRDQKQCKKALNSMCTSERIIYIDAP